MTADGLAVLLDTDVYSRIYIPRDREADVRVTRWRALLEGKRVVIAFQSRAELLSGAFQGGWGTGRVNALRVQLDKTPTISVDEEVIEAYAQLTATCRSLGHALHGKEHTGDRWVAACAIAKGVALLSGDGIFTNAPSLELLR